MKCALCASFITAFPKAESDQPEWQDAIEALMLVATSGGLTAKTTIRTAEAEERRMTRKCWRMFTARKSRSPKCRRHRGKDNEDGVHGLDRYEDSHPASRRHQGRAFSAASSPSSRAVASFVVMVTAIIFRNSAISFCPWSRSHSKSAR